MQLEAVLNLGKAGGMERREKGEESLKIGRVGELTLGSPYGVRNEERVGKRQREREERARDFK